MSSLGKVNLKSLENEGDLITSIPTGIEDSSSDGIDAILDGDTTTTKLAIKNLGGVEQVRLKFDPFVACRKIRLKISTGHTENYDVYLNNDFSVIKATATGLGHASNIATKSYEILTNGLSQIDIKFGNSFSATAHELYQIELQVIEVADPYEFNDSILETKAWKSSRYDGRQLSATAINKATINDVGNNDKTPIIRKYTRNIYIGNEIVGMNEELPEDPNLIQFSDFSYIQINSYITVNEDGSINVNTLDIQGASNTQKKSFYRPFTKDFPESSFCNLILGDKTVKNNLLSQYPVFFNGGQLKKILALQTPTQGIVQLAGQFPANNSRADSYPPIANNLVIYTERVFITGSGGGTDFDYPLGDAHPTDPYPGKQPVRTGEKISTLMFGGVRGETGETSGEYMYGTSHTASLYNKDLYIPWHTGSLTTFGRLENIVPTQTVANDHLDTDKLTSFFRNFFNYKLKSNYTGDKRIFATACPFHPIEYYPPLNGPIPDNIIQGNKKPLYTFDFDSYHTGSGVSGIRDNKLSNLGTFEIGDINVVSKTTYKIYELIFNIRSKSLIDASSYQGVFNTGAQMDSTVNTTFGKGHVPNFNSGSVLFSIVDDAVPSLLVPLKKDRELQNGKGDKPFIVIPENIHPYVKDNILLYIAKAGIDLSENTVDKIEENIKQKPKAPSLPRPQRVKIARRKVSARVERKKEAKKELDLSKREQRQAKRSERRADREERRDQRRGTRQDRRENRRERREDRRENRQENRNNRRENRQNRRENRRNRRRRR